MTKLPVLAEIGAPVAADGRPYGLRRLDLEALERVRAALGRRRAVLVTGPSATAEARGDHPDAAGSAPVGPVQALAVGLAGVASAAGTRTVLVECDIGRPRLAADLGLRPAPGLHEYLRWEATPEDVVQTLVPVGSAAGEGAEPVACICAGRPSESARTLLGLGSFRHMTAKLREAYELTILLGPPLGGTGGATDLVAAEADCSIVALARRPDRRSRKWLRDATSWRGPAPLGAVVVTDEP